MKCLTISHFFVCLPTLELITFGQQLFSKKRKVNQMYYNWEKAAAKKERSYFEQRTSSKNGPEVQLGKWLVGRTNLVNLR